MAGGWVGRHFGSHFFKKGVCI
jgi:hypothetical protein